MPKWTEEQSLAIEKSGSNIIVSAGAGSGKTAVLSERVLYKLENGIHITELLILTFTRAAAEEMKDRIRKKIKKVPHLKKENDALDSAYITTFDSFALSVVKKYHYLANIPSDVAITDDSIVAIEKKRILDEVFDDAYKSANPNFVKLIDRFCIKNDTIFRNSIGEISYKIEGLERPQDFLKFLKSDLYSKENVDKYIDLYKRFIQEKKNNISSILNSLSNYFDSEYITKLESLILPILNTENISDFCAFKEIKLPPVPKGSDEVAKQKKSSLKEALDELLNYTSYGNEDDIKEEIMSTKETVFAISDIIEEYLKRLQAYKLQNGIYTFQDIATLAIDILKKNESARLELKNHFKEIMIDEYQDTNDIQESFISLIADNNVYMVGDVKQSIYRFRGANPDIFKNKYDAYSKSDGGFKIDLIKNFRSRAQVLNNINKLFDLLMDNTLGGASYKESHEMVYGNSLYDEKKENEYNYDFEILEYENNETEFSNNEIEIFTIAQDIKKKIRSKMHVFDKETSEMRPIQYKDFVIILDRSKYFDDFKKIFEYLDIPLSILKDGSLNANVDMYLIKNMFDFVLRIKKRDFGIDFKYDFLSIARSYLYEYSDEYIFNVISENRIYETTLYDDFANIDGINSLSSMQLFEIIIEKTKMYEHISKVGDYENINVRLSKLDELAETLSNSGKTIEEFRDYLNEVLTNDYQIKYSEWNSNSDAVTILTIHKSKGLEYPICYFADLDHNFNIAELKNKFIVDKDYGLIVPNSDDETKPSILKILYKNRFIKEEIGEKIRLFYVALTRAREQMIIVLPKKDTEKLEINSIGTIDLMYRLNFNRLSSLIYASKEYLLEYFKTVDIESLNLTKDYLYQKSANKLKLDKVPIKFEVDEIKIDNSIVEDEKFSKDTHKLIEKKDSYLMEIGTKIHEILEYLDFENPDLSSIKNEFIKDKINDFLNSNLIKNSEKKKYYREYEFYYEDKETIRHGIIDLIIETENSYKIVDYKLKNVDDDAYIRQLNGYREYLKTLTGKPVETYLYSIIDSIIKKI